MSQVRAYVPELLMTEGKDQPHMRVCREECALLDPANKYRVLAGRGIDLKIGEPFAPFAALPASERDFMERALARTNRVLVNGKRGPLLIFGDLLPYSGLLFVVAPHFDERTLRRGLYWTAHAGFTAEIPIFEESLPLQREDEEVCRALEEMFYYLDRIFSDLPTPGLWTRTQLIANFAGCLLDQVQLPPEMPDIPRGERLRLTAFLLCAFFTMRRHSEIVDVEGGAASDAFRYRMEFEGLEGFDPSASEDYAFLHHGPFSRFLFARDGDRFAIEGHLITEQHSHGLRALSTPMAYLGLLLSLQNRKAPDASGL